MKKQAFFLFVTLFIFLFACDFDFKVPKEIEILKKTPELRFSPDKEYSELVDAFGDLNFDFGHDAEVNDIDCINTEIITKVIYVELYNDDVLDEYGNISNSSEFQDDGDNYYTDDERVNLVWSEDAITIKAPDFTGTQLEGFLLKPSQTRLYLSGTNQELIDMLGVELFVIEKDEFGVDIHIPINDEPYGGSAPSGFSKSDTEYSGLSLPSSDNEFEILITDDFHIEFIVFVYPYQTIPKEWLEDFILLVEIAVWFPFEFIAGPDVKDMKMPFDKLFSDTEDLFGRKSVNDNDSVLEYIEEIHMEIALSKMPFPNSSVVLISGEFEKYGSISGNSINIPVDKDEINFPFIPAIYARFKEGEEINVPRVLILEKFGFKASLKHVIDIDLPKGWS